MVKAVQEPQVVQLPEIKPVEKLPEVKQPEMNPMLAHWLSKRKQEKLTEVKDKRWKPLIPR